MTKVLLIDDDIELSSLLITYLEKEGFEVETARDGALGAKWAVSGEFAIVVLDVRLPGLNGIDVLRRIRGESAIPIIMLTACSDCADRIVGLELGADDYMPKPCAPGELAARLRAVLRRATGRQPDPASTNLIEVDELRLWPGARRAEWRGLTVELTAMEFRILEFLACRAGQVVGRDELSQAVLGSVLPASDRRIDVHISSIRHKLGKAGGGDTKIRAVRGQGYQLLKD